MQLEDHLLELNICASDGSTWSSSGPPSLIKIGPCTSLGRFHVVALTPLPDRGYPSKHLTTASSAVVQGEDGLLKLYAKGGQLENLAPSACFPEQCAIVSPISVLSSASLSSRPVVGLSGSSGKLFWGSELIASEVTSFALRSGGAGGPALLYTTRRSLLYTVFFRQLISGSYHHRELLASNATKTGPRQLLDEQKGQPDDSDSQQQQPSQQQRHQPSQKLGAAGIYVRHDDNRRDDDMRAAMHAAMRPSELDAAARDIVVRAVEQGSRLVSVPQGRCGSPCFQSGYIK